MKILELIHIRYKLIYLLKNWKTSTCHKKTASGSYFRNYLTPRLQKQEDSFIRPREIYFFKEVSTNYLFQRNKYKKLNFLIREIHTDFNLAIPHLAARVKVPMLKLIHAKLKPGQKLANRRKPVPSGSILLYIPCH